MHDDDDDDDEEEEKEDGDDIDDRILAMDGGTSSDSILCTFMSIIYCQTT